MEHLNYYQLFQLLLEKSVDASVHANNKIIHGIITLMGESPFNDWYADILEDMQTHTKLSFADMLKMSSSKLHQTLISKPISRPEFSCVVYSEKSIISQDSNIIIDEMLYHAMTLKSSFWDIHEEIIEIHFK